METCKFKVGQLWRTRRGDDVEIVRVNDLNGQYPVIGRMNKENWERSWTKDGKFAAGAEEIPRGGDLVELLKDVPEKESFLPQVGDVWLTRGGDHAIVDSCCGGSFPLGGVITKEGTFSVVYCRWRYDGRFLITEIHENDLIERISTAPVAVTNTPRQGDAPGSRDRAGPPTPRSEPVGLKESIGRLATKGTGVVTVENAYETYEDVKAWLEFKADPTPIKWPKLPDTGEVWKTRGGKEASVTGVLAGYPRAICGCLDDAVLDCWWENGRVLRYEEHENDLVEFVRRIQPVIVKGTAAVFGDVDGVLPDGTVKVKLGGNVEQESIADEARRIVAGVRRKQYGGTPERSFTAIADFWTALFKAKGRPEMVFTAEDVSPMMRLLKEARLCSSPDHRDSMVDIIGYTLTDAELRGIETPPAPEV